LRAAYYNMIASACAGAVLIGLFIVELIADTVGNGSVTAVGVALIGVALATFSVLYARRQFRATLIEAQRGWTSRRHLQEDVVDIFKVDEKTVGGLSLAATPNAEATFAAHVIRPALDAAQVAAARAAMPDGDLSVQDTAYIPRGDVVPGHEEMITRITGDSGAVFAEEGKTNDE
jgi:hypothetical protein